MFKKAQKKYIELKEISNEAHQGMLTYHSGNLEIWEE